MKRLDLIFNRAKMRVETKGKARHNTSDNLVEQPIFTILQALQSDASPLLFQAVKKIYESGRLPSQLSIDELLDAIVYLACAIIYKEKLSQEDS